MVERMAGETWDCFGRRVRWLNTTLELGTVQDGNISTAWGDWLGTYPWDAWGTLTFKAGEFSHDAATRAWNRFASKCAADHPLATWFVGHEVGSQGRLHLHCLLGGMLRRDYEARKELWEWWFSRYGRAQIIEYDPELGASRYVAKYVVKEFSHYDVDLRGFTCLSQIVNRRRDGGGSWSRKRSAAD